MDKTANDIRISAQLLCGSEIDERTSFIWVKTCIDEMVRDYPATASTYYTETFTIDEPYGMYTAEHYITTLDKVLANISGTKAMAEEGVYELHDNSLTFTERGNYEIRYFGNPEPPETYTTEINMPEKFIDCIKYYVAARITARLYGRDDTSALAHMDEYQRAVIAADNFMHKRVQRTRKMPPARKGI